MNAISKRKGRTMSKFWSQLAQEATPYVPGEQLNKTDIIKLNTNENPYPPSPKVIEAIQAEAGESLRLYPSPSMDKLRQTIANYHGLDKGNIFVGNGSDEVLAFSFMGFFNPKEEIVFPEVTYSFYPVYANLFQIPYKTVALHDGFTLHAEDLDGAEGGVIFPNPNAPTGVYLPLEQVEQIVLENSNKVVIIDEAYIDFAPKSASAIPLTKKYNNLLVIQTMSKSRALAGLRIGFAVGHEDLIEALMRMKDSFNSYPVDRLAMAGAQAAIEDESYFKQQTKKIIETRNWTKQSLEKLSFRVLPSAANFLFVTHPKQDAGTLYEKLRELNILIRYFGKPPIEEYLRISIGTPEEMNQLIDALKKICH